MVPKQTLGEGRPIVRVTVNYFVSDLPRRFIRRHDWFARWKSGWLSWFRALFTEDYEPDAQCADEYKTDDPWRGGGSSVCPVCFRLFFGRLSRHSLSPRQFSLRRNWIIRRELRKSREPCIM